MHELIILGILQENEYYGYQLKQRADKLLVGCYEVSYGALYPKFKKLEASGYIISRLTYSKGGQEKTFYNITDKGKEYFKDIMLNYPKESFANACDRFQVKVLFFNYIDEETKRAILDNTKALIEKEIKAIESSISYEQNLDDYKISLLKFNLSTLKIIQTWIEGIK